MSLALRMTSGDGRRWRRPDLVRAHKNQQMKIHPATAPHRRTQQPYRRPKRDALGLGKFQRRLTQFSASLPAGPVARFPYLAWCPGDGRTRTQHGKLPRHIWASVRPLQRLGLVRAMRREMHCAVRACVKSPWTRTTTFCSRDVPRFGTHFESPV